MRIAHHFLPFIFQKILFNFVWHEAVTVCVSITSLFHLNEKLKEIIIFFLHRNVEEEYSPYIFWVLATAEPTPPPVTCPFRWLYIHQKIDFSPTRNFHLYKINQIYFPFLSNKNEFENSPPAKKRDSNETKRKKLNRNQFVAASTFFIYISAFGSDFVCYYSQLKIKYSISYV